jgi:hypothetical protein
MLHTAGLLLYYCECCLAVVNAMRLADDSGVRQAFSSIEPCPGLLVAYHCPARLHEGNGKRSPGGNHAKLIASTSNNSVSPRSAVLIFFFFSRSREAWRPLSNWEQDRDRIDCHLTHSTFLDGDSLFNACSNNLNTGIVLHHR